MMTPSPCPYDPTESGIILNRETLNRVDEFESSGHTVIDTSPAGEKAVRKVIRRAGRMDG